MKYIKRLIILSGEKHKGTLSVEKNALPTEAVFNGYGNVLGATLAVMCDKKIVRRELSGTRLVFSPDFDAPDIIHALVYMGDKVLMYGTNDSHRMTQNEQRRVFAVGIKQNRANNASQASQTKSVNTENLSDLKNDGNNANQANNANQIIQANPAEEDIKYFDDAIADSDFYTKEWQSGVTRGSSPLFNNIEIIWQEQKPVDIATEFAVTKKIVTEETAEEVKEEKIKTEDFATEEIRTENVKTEENVPKEVISKENVLDEIIAAVIEDDNSIGDITKAAVVEDESSTKHTAKAAMIEDDNAKEYKNKEVKSSTNKGEVNTMYIQNNRKELPSAKESAHAMELFGLKDQPYAKQAPQAKESSYAKESSANEPSQTNKTFSAQQTSQTKESPYAKDSTGAKESPSAKERDFLSRCMSGMEPSGSFATEKGNNFQYSNDVPKSSIGILNNPGDKSRHGTNQIPPPFVSEQPTPSVVGGAEIYNPGMNNPQIYNAGMNQAGMPSGSGGAKITERVSLRGYPGNMSGDNNFSGKGNISGMNNIGNLRNFGNLGNYESMDNTGSAGSANKIGGMDSAIHPANILETAAHGFSRIKGREGTFFEKCGEEIERLFDSPREQNLQSLIPGSKWVRINYDSDRYYVIGLIGKDYLCYGVPADYTPDPPDELKGYCWWLPLTPDQPKGKGYWIMYQSLTSGEAVFPQ